MRSWRTRGGGCFRHPTVVAAPLSVLLLHLAFAIALAAPLAGQAALRRPQEPVPPYPYRADEVVYPSSAARIQLAGTLTLPASAGPHPAVVLISGSGPQDRDSEMYTHKVFLVLADYLTRRGIAVLRSDDRGVGRSGGVFRDATIEDLADDARSALAYLASRPDIRSDAVGVLGHSEGGEIAASLATNARPLAFVVLLASPAVPGRDILLTQSALVSRVMGAGDEQLAYNRKLQEELFAAIEAEPEEALRAKRMEAVLRAQIEAVPEEERRATGLTASAADEFVQSQIRTNGSASFRSFLLYDPRPALRQLRVPVLAIGGSKDLQVPPAPNLAEMRVALASNPDATIRELPGLNHLLQTAQLGVPAEYSRIDETISPTALEAIATWILEHTKQPDVSRSVGPR
jgi:uncharacterized protein